MKKPKKPKNSSGMAVWKRYEAKLKEYEAWKKLKERLNSKAASL